jgi:hypothetical protein
VSGRHRRERRQQPGPPSVDERPPSPFGFDSSAARPHSAASARRSRAVVITAGHLGAASSPEVAELLEELTSVRLQRRELDGRQERLVEALLRAGVSWGRLGAALGVTRQAAHKRYSST